MAELGDHSGVWRPYRLVEARELQVHQCLLEQQQRWREGSAAGTAVGIVRCERVVIIVVNRRMRT